MADIDGDRNDNELIGTRRADRIQGMEGDDTIRGRGGRDELMGGMGDDRMWGNNGADLLKDGFGVDKLWGGRGADVFEFVRLEGIGGIERDVVKDFEDERDLIDLSAVTNDFDGLVIRNTQSGDVRIKIDDRVIILQDRDNTLRARDMTEDDFILI